MRKVSQDGTTVGPSCCVVLSLSYPETFAILTRLSPNTVTTETPSGKTLCSACCNDNPCPWIIIVLRHYSVVVSFRPSRQGVNFFRCHRRTLLKNGRECVHVRQEHRAKVPYSVSLSGVRLIVGEGKNYCMGGPQKKKKVVVDPVILHSLAIQQRDSI